VANREKRKSFLFETHGNEKEKDKTKQINFLLSFFTDFLSNSRLSLTVIIMIERTAVIV